MSILKPVKLTQKQILGLVPATAILNFDGAEKALNTLANHFKREGASEILNKIKTDNPYWAKKFKVYLDMLEAKL